MWILPNNLNVSSPFVPASEASNEELKWLAQQYSQSALWKSKQWSAQTWWQRWKRVYWLRILFGRTLRPSQSSDISFVEKWTASLEVTPANRFLSLGSVKESQTLDTFGRLYEKSLTQLDLFGASSKTSMTTSRWDLDKFTAIYATWVIQLREMYSVRLRRTRHMIASVSSSSRWKTPQGSDGEGGVMREVTGDGHFKLRDQVAWTTPCADDNNRSTKYKQGGTSLSLQAKWMTPLATESEENYQVYIDRMRASEDPKNNTKNNPRNLSMQVSNQWPTPTTQESKHNLVTLKARQKRLKAKNNGKNGTKHSGNGVGPNLATKVSEQWPTPNSRDYKAEHGEESEAFQKRMEHSRGVNLPEFLQRAKAWPTPTFAGNNQGSLQEWGGSGNKFRGQPDQENPSTNGEFPRTLTREAESNVGLSADGYDFREDFLRASGNAVVPATAATAWINLWTKMFDQ